MSLFEHLAKGSTSICRCWLVQRRDGEKLGFTDHDSDIEFGGVVFKAESGMSARAFHQSTGLSVDNSEAAGALSADALRADDIRAGRYDGATIRMWLVNWAAPGQRFLRFSGTLGEIVEAGNAFRVELRGLTESLNKPQGIVYQRRCSAVLGDQRCRVDLERSEYQAKLRIDRVSAGKTFTFGTFPSFATGWFQHGRLHILGGAGAGLMAHVKSDRTTGGGRLIVLWEAIRARLEPGDRIQLVAGCDKRAWSCRSKFDNFVNFRGFPSIPGEDWLMAYPTDRVPSDGGRL